MLVLLLLIDENVKGTITISKYSLACEIILLFYLFPFFLCCYFLVTCKNTRYKKRKEMEVKKETSLFPKHTTLRAIITKTFGLSLLPEL